MPITPGMRFVRWRLFVYIFGGLVLVLGSNLFALASSGNPSSGPSDLDKFRRFCSEQAGRPYTLPKVVPNKSLFFAQAPTFDNPEMNQLISELEAISIHPASFNVVNYFCQVVIEGVKANQNILSCRSALQQTRSLYKKYHEATPRHQQSSEKLKSLVHEFENAKRTVISKCATRCSTKKGDDNLYKSFSANLNLENVALEAFLNEKERMFDIIPLSIIMGIRGAETGNNEKYPGYNPYGLMPNGKDHIRFSNLGESTQYLIDNFNCYSKKYSGLQKLRQKARTEAARQSCSSISGKAVISGLGPYNPHNPKYPERVNNIIRDYSYLKLDSFWKSIECANSASRPVPINGGATDDFGIR